MATASARRGKGWRGVAIAALVVVFVAGVLPFALPWRHQDGAIPAQPYPESRYVDVDGVRLHVRAWPAKPPRRDCEILLLHGSLASTHAWNGIAPSLARTGRGVVAVDLPGAGWSARRATSHGDDPALLWHLLDTLGQPGQRWCLVGHARGARTAAAMLAAAPERVAAMIYLDGTPLRDASRVVPGWQRALLSTAPGRRWYAGWFDRNVITPEAIGAMLRADYGRAPTPAEVDAYLAPLRVPGTAADFARALADDDRATYAAPSVLASRPTLVLWGREDRRASPTLGGDAVRAIAGAEGRALDRLGHRPMEQDPQAVLGAMLGWLDGLGARAPAPRAE